MRDTALLFLDYQVLLKEMSALLAFSFHSTVGVRVLMKLYDEIFHLYPFYDVQKKIEPLKPADPIYLR